MFLALCRAPLNLSQQKYWKWDSWHPRNEDHQEEAKSLGCSILTLEQLPQGSILSFPLGSR